MKDSDLLLELNKLYEQLRNEKLEMWKRDLPFDELMFDRWERAKFLGFGEKTSIYHNSYVFGDVKVGENTWIGPYTILDGSGGIEIGNFCSISSGVHIYSHNTVKWAVSLGKMPYEYLPVSIGDGCFIGPQSIIAAGTKIGRQSIVAANCFVNIDVPEFSIVAGSPSIVIGKVEVNEDGSVLFRYNKNSSEK